MRFHGMRCGGSRRRGSPACRVLPVPRYIDAFAAPISTAITTDIEGSQGEIEHHRARRGRLRLLAAVISLARSPGKTMRRWSSRSPSAATWR